MLNRIKELIDSKGLSISAFEREIQASDGMIRRAIKNGSDIQSRWIANISDKFPDVNLDWLITGKGEMYKNYQQETPISDNYHVGYKYSSKTQNKIESQLIPLLDINASAGLNLLFNTDRENIVDYIQIPNLSKVDGAMFITGDSMYPLLKSGDIVVFKQMQDFQYILWGEIYILSYSIGGDDYVVIKYVNKGDLEEHVKLVSYNTHHSPVEIPITAIRAMALVKASVRYNTMM